MKFTLVVPYYNEPDILEKQVKAWKEIERKDLVEFVVVDDGSKETPIDLLKDLDFNVRLYRIKKDIFWNSAGAKNLGFTVANTEWVLSTDVDHILTNDTVNALLVEDIKESCYYTLARRDLETGKDYHSPPGILLLRKKSFWEVGGSDEDFAGCYGYEDL